MNQSNEMADLPKLFLEIGYEWTEVIDPQLKCLICVGERLCLIHLSSSSTAKCRRTSSAVS